MSAHLRLILVLLTLAPTLHANGVIVHAARKLRLSYAEPTPEKDFFINLGRRDGVRVGDKYPVQRPVSVRDSQTDGTIHVMGVPVGVFEVTVVGETAAMGRQQLFATPAVSMQYLTFMVGDEVLTKTSLPLGSTLP